MANTQFPPGTNPLLIDALKRRPDVVSYDPNTETFNILQPNHAFKNHQLTHTGQFILQPGMPMEMALDLGDAYKRDFDRDNRFPDFGTHIIQDGKPLNRDSLNVVEHNQKYGDAAQSALATDAAAEQAFDTVAQQTRDVTMSPWGAVAISLGTIGGGLGLNYAANRTGVKPWVKFNFRTAQQHINPLNLARWSPQNTLKEGPFARRVYNQAPLPASNIVDSRLLTFTRTAQTSKIRSLQELVRTKFRGIDLTKVKPEVMDALLKQYEFMGPRFLSKATFPHATELQAAVPPKPIKPVKGDSVVADVVTPAADNVVNEAAQRGGSPAAKAVWRSLFRAGRKGLIGAVGLLGPLGAAASPLLTAADAALTAKELYDVMRSPYLGKREPVTNQHTFVRPQTPQPLQQDTTSPTRGFTDYIDLQRQTAEAAKAAPRRKTFRERGPVLSGMRQ